MALTLGIDTATVVSVGVSDGSKILAALQVQDTRSHVERLIPLVEKALEQAGVGYADLEAVAVGVGPGPFTGLRVGVAAAEVIAQALGLPLKGICGLDVIARQALRVDSPLIAAAAVSGQEPAFVALCDARRKELYWAAYSAAGQRVDGPFVTGAEDIPPLPSYGQGADLYPLPGQIIGSAPGVDAGLLALLADDLPDAGLEPLYLRRPDAEVPAARKSVLPRLVIRRPA
ncbi:MAG: tRNA (adenosine(37)-N6)-threonylcarbamoyltransferase complex dimerization subunit type 1 TsaB [Propionibacteriaceae bacterium]|jgi:tRNA threonylcarbamoyl adenosine modification protein YeaZ|nr:tRNA (adenosine(37)-N6)-threonylcarbamoyltransferase complex dimerization subunit type 1 TsaB [Propionibacteriaceae bacterium]